MRRGYAIEPGARYGKLTAVEQGTFGEHPKWVWKCDCGTVRAISVDAVRSGRQTTCAQCVHPLAVRATRRGETRHPLHRVWTHMIDRCTNERAHNYKWYGATGVSVCSRWLASFDAFAEDVGERPAGTTLDRFPNKHGNYEPGNVRWATKVEQSNNARNNLVCVIDGRSQTLKQWSREFGVSYLRLYHQAVTLGRDPRESVLNIKQNPGRFMPYSTRAEVCAMLRDGASTKDIQAALGVSKGTISRWRHAIGMAIRTYKKRPEST